MWGGSSSLPGRIEKSLLCRVPIVLSGIANTDKLGQQATALKRLIAGGGWVDASQAEIAEQQRLRNQQEQEEREARARRPVTARFDPKPAARTPLEATVNSLLGD